MLIVAATRIRGSSIQEFPVFEGRDLLVGQEHHVPIPRLTLHPDGRLDAFVDRKVVWGEEGGTMEPGSR